MLKTRCAGVRARPIAHLKSAGGWSVAGIRWHSVIPLVEPASGLLGGCASPHGRCGPWQWTGYCARPRARRDERGCSGVRGFPNRPPNAGRPPRDLRDSRRWQVDVNSGCRDRVGFPRRCTDRSYTNYPPKRNRCVTGRGRTWWAARRCFQGGLRFAGGSWGSFDTRDRLRTPSRGRLGYRFRPVRIA